MNWQKCDLKEFFGIIVEETIFYLKFIIIIIIFFSKKNKQNSKPKIISSLTMANLGMQNRQPHTLKTNK